MGTDLRPNAATPKRLIFQDYILWVFNLIKKDDRKS
jgi:hypothetical protein